MTDPQRYSIIFNGELRADTRRGDALEKIALFTNLDTDELLDSLFSIKPVIINQVENSELAEAYLEAFGDAGLEVYAEPFTESHDEMVNAAIEFSHYAPIERQETQLNYLIETPDVDVANVDNAENSPGYAEASLFRLLFCGELVSGFSKDQAVDNICHLTKSEPEQVMEQIFSVVPVVLVESPDQEIVETYREEFAAAGLVSEVSEEVSGDDGLAISRLRLRNDAPSPPVVKRVPPFVYLLSGLACVSAVLWSAIYLFNRGYFDQEPQPTLEVKLEYVIPAPVKPAPQPDPKEVIEEIAALPPPEIRKKPIPEAAPKQAVAPVVTPPPAPKQVASPSPTVRPVAAPLPANLSEKALAELEQEYFIELLNWFAQPQHHGYDSQTRTLNLEGDIKIRITIHRNGNLKQTEVLSSSSERLTQVTEQSAINASPYPAVPDEIAGDSYSFTLPLKYTLED